MYFINEPESKVPIKSAGTYYNYYLKRQKTNKHAQAFLFRTSAFFFFGAKNILKISRSLNWECFKKLYLYSGN